MSRTAFIYTRISQDRDGESTAPERQLAAAHELAAAEGFTVPPNGVYEDRNVSASKRGVIRPEFERLLKDAAAQGATIIAWNQDRLVRQVTDCERLIMSGAQVRTVVGDTAMLNDVQGQLMMRLKAVVGAYEGAIQGVRARAKAKERAELGLPSPGHGRSFGHSPSQTELHPEEAPVVVELCRRILEGERLSELVRELRARGITATTGRDFTLTSLTYVLKSARIAGARELPGGELRATGAIAPIISVETLLEVRATLAARHSRHGNRSNARRHLLAGILYCGKCGSRMVADGGANWRRYRCPSANAVQGKGCGGVSMAAAPLEAFVTDYVLALEDSIADEIGEALGEATASPTAELVRELRAIDTRRAELKADYLERIIDQREFRAMIADLDAERARAELALEAHSATRARDTLPTGEALREAWELGDLGYRRSVLEALVDRITIAPREGGRGGRFDSSRIHVELTA